jgi:hypothetical protein
VTQKLDNGGPLNSQIDVDPGPGTFNVYTETQNLLRYDSTFAFLGHASIGYGDQRMCVDASGAVYLMAQASAGAGFWAVKFNGAGQDMVEVYSTPLTTTGNLRLGDIAADEQGGCLGMYSNNCTASKIRFYKMNVSGLVDFSLFLNSGNDCTLPVGKGFDLRGGSFVMGTINNNYTVDFDPTADNLYLPTGNNDGVVARYDWCASAPFEPFGIGAITPICVGSEAQFVVDAFGDASSYAWSLPQGWTVVSQGDTLTANITTAGDALMVVAATNSCGTSGPITAQFTATEALVDAGPDLLICLGQSALLSAVSPNAGSYLWQPGDLTTPSVEVAPAVNTTYTVIITAAGCTATDTIQVLVDPCMGIEEGVEQRAVQLYPVPVARGQALHINGLSATLPLRITAADGRDLPVILSPTTDGALLNTAGLTPGVYLLHSTEGMTWRFVVGQ